MKNQRADEISVDDASQVGGPVGVQQVEVQQLGPRIGCPPEGHVYPPTPDLSGDMALKVFCDTWEAIAADFGRIVDPWRRERIKDAVASQEVRKVEAAVIEQVRRWREADEAGRGRETVMQKMKTLGNVREGMAWIRRFVAESGKVRDAS